MRILPILTMLFLTLQLQAQSWQNMAEMPTRRSETASTVLNGKIYVAGGINFGGSLKAFEVYDPDSNAWQKLAHLPRKLNHCGLAALNGKIYLSGGYTDLFQKKPSLEFYVYDPDSNRWQRLPDMPGPRAGHSMIAFQGKLQVIGGRPPHSVNCWTYDATSASWQADLLPPLPGERDHLVPLIQGQDLVIIGGRYTGGTRPDCLRLSPGDRVWREFSRLDYPRGGHAAAAWNGQLFFAGGEDLGAKRTLALNERLPDGGTEWKLATSLPVARHGMTSQVIKGKWYLIGGANQAKAGTIISCKKEVWMIGL